MPPENEVTRLLLAHRRGEKGATDQLFELVYEELRALAHRQLQYRRPGETINTTALVHEAYLKMVDHEQGTWQDRAHFFAVTARAMRHILVDYARMVRAEKRGGQAQRTELRTSALKGESLSAEILDLDEALAQLAQLNPRLAEIVELRFFGGLSVEEIAGVLNVSSRTVDRDWYKAKAFLYLILREDEDA